MRQDNEYISDADAAYKRIGSNGRNFLSDSYFFASAGTSGVLRAHVEECSCQDHQQNLYIHYERDPFDVAADRGVFCTFLCIRTENTELQIPGYHHCLCTELCSIFCGNLPAGQYEAAKVLGYTKAQTFMRIILPQVIKRILPPVTNETITLVKDTSLAFVLAQAEMFTMAKQIAAKETSIMPLMAAGLFYYIFNLIVAFAMERLEKALNYYK